MSAVAMNSNRGGCRPRRQLRLVPRIDALRPAGSPVTLGAMLASLGAESRCPLCDGSLEQVETACSQLLSCRDCGAEIEDLRYAETGVGDAA